MISCYLFYIEPVSPALMKSANFHDIQIKVVVGKTFTEKIFPYSTSLDKKKLHPTFIIIQYTFHNIQKITA